MVVALGVDECVFDDQGSALPLYATLRRLSDDIEGAHTPYAFDAYTSTWMVGSTGCPAALPKERASAWR